MIIAESRTSDNRVLRGDSRINNGRNCRSANRNHNLPGNANENFGFRLARARCAVGMGVYDQTFIRSRREYSRRAKTKTAGRASKISECDLNARRLADLIP